MPFLVLCKRISFLEFECGFEDYSFSDKCRQDASNAREKHLIVVVFSQKSNELALLLKTNLMLVGIFVLSSSFVVDDNFHFDINAVLCVFDDDDVFVCS